ncbi:MAG TPA: FHA domain-containing protein [Pirellulaceae bacterium]|nr:FHA domain-containing protein [Pirellulaceae bacterium]
MNRITLRVLDGADRGRVFDELPTPVTIGREEGNTIQLNDERVSRYHVKIQEDNERLVLTDLESTNGTKVNGEDIQLRILRHGDMIAVGRSVLLFGSRDEIAERLAKFRKQNGQPADDDGTIHPSDAPQQLSRAMSQNFDLAWSDEDELQAAFHTMEPPELPDRMSPSQAAQLAELLDYLHIRLRQLLATVEPDRHSQRVTLEFQQWQELLDLQARISEYLRQIGEPGQND